MRLLVSAMLVAAAVIHLLPLTGVLGGERLAALYGVAVDGADLQILLRHRAVLFGLIGALLLAAAWQPAWQPLALVAGVVSVISFLVIAWSVGGYNERMGRVVAADLVALVCLIVAAAARAVLGDAD